MNKEEKKVLKEEDKTESRNGKSSTGEQQEAHSEAETETDETESGNSRKIRKELKADARKIDELNEKITGLEATVADITAKLAKEKDDYVRLMADFDNFRRRSAQDRLDLVSSASEDTIKGLLPVLDDCERAIKALEDSEDSPVAKEGTNLIYSKLLGYLKSKGLTAIEAEGAVFDTDEHEAISRFPVQEEEKKGRVFDVVQTGYKLNGKVIRFAKVVVGI